MDRSRIYKVRGKRWKGAMGLCLAAVLAMAVLAGCSRKTAAVSGARTVDKEYTKGQMMVIAITERNRYQNIYTSELWSVKADQNGDTFEDRLMDQAEQFLIELATTNLMADEQGIELTGQEKDALKSLAQEYYRNLSEQDRRFMDVSEDEVYDLYCEYYRADKLVAELTKNENLEVSDAEAKVIGQARRDTGKGSGKAQNLRDARTGGSGLRRRARSGPLRVHLRPAKPPRGDAES